MRKRQFRNVVFEGDKITGEELHGGYAGIKEFWGKFSASRSLLHIQLAIEKYPILDKKIWAMQDGYGIAGYTPAQGWDWSGIRDSKPETISKMYQLARDYMRDGEFLAILDADNRPVEEVMLEALNACRTCLDWSDNPSTLNLVIAAIERAEKEGKVKG